MKEQPPTNFHDAVNPGMPERTLRDSQDELQVAYAAALKLAAEQGSPQGTPLTATRGRNGIDISYYKPVYTQSAVPLTTTRDKNGSETTSYYHPTKR